MRHTLNPLPASANNYGHGVVWCRHNFPLFPARAEIMIDYRSARGERKWSSQALNSTRGSLVKILEIFQFHVRKRKKTAPNKTCL